MVDRNDGGPAFPFEFTEGSSADVTPPERLTHTGMTMLDYFAAQAMPVMVNRIFDLFERGIAVGTDAATFDTAAAKSYALARAMLAERAKNSS
jgi:dihydroorotase-like cyclic amidohydrolase